MPGMKKKGVKKPMKKGTPQMSYNQTMRQATAMMNKGGGTKPTALINALKKKYPNEFGYGGGTAKKPMMKKGGKSGMYKRRKK